MPNVVNITERHQAVVGAREYDAFGQVLVQTADWSDSDFGFHPNWLQLKGVAGGRYYLTPGGRAYDTNTGRFLSRDPLHAPTADRYVALANSPAGVVDPTGRLSIRYPRTPDVWWQEWTGAERQAWWGGFRRLLGKHIRWLREKGYLE